LTLLSQFSLEGGTGSAYKKVITNATSNSYCYNYSAFSRTIVLKALRELPAPFAPTNDIIQF